MARLTCVHAAVTSCAILCWIVIACVAAADEAVSGPSDAPHESLIGKDQPGNNGDGDGGNGLDNAADDLDRLLNIADRDVSQLANVNVTSTVASTAAPSMKTEVTTVSRQKSTIGKSPAAVFVVTNEMIRRSGVRTIPDALRMAPGVQVARIDSSKWAISIRGFNGRFAYKLLVQIDGRTVYTPLFGGVFWDVQDVLLEDVDRIEIIRGPGGTIWGANAVNGIINVITKNAAETQGIYAEVGGGTYERNFASARYGGRLGENTHYRVYSKWFERDEGGDVVTPFSPSDNNHDDWRMSRGGFRIDSTPNYDDHFTAQGDWYAGYTGRRNFYPDPSPVPPTPFFNTVDDDAKVTGGNVLTRWTRSLDDETEWSLQTYYDRTERHYLAAGFREDRETIDIDFQYRFPLGCFHKVICGAGYRNTRDKIQDVPFVIDWDPNSRALDLFSYFIQDEINLYREEWFLTLGGKFQHNDFTGFEIQPTLRLLWLPDDRHSMWASVSRAVRTPTRADDDIRVTLQRNMGVFPRIFGSRNFLSEEVVAYEAGIRGQPIDRFSWDLALFYNNYDRLSSQALGPPFLEFFPPPTPPAVVLPSTLTNGGAKETYGFELFGSYELSDAWRLFGSFSFIDADIDGTDPIFDSNRNQAYLQSSWDFCCDWHLDMIWRYTDTLRAQNVPSYNTADVRLAWRPNRGFEAAIVGRNLLQSAHQEWGFDAFTGNVQTEVRREFYGMIALLLTLLFLTFMRDRPR